MAGKDQDDQASHGEPKRRGPARLKPATPHKLDIKQLHEEKAKPYGGHHSDSIPITHDANAPYTPSSNPADSVEPFVMKDVADIPDEKEIKTRGRPRKPYKTTDLLARIKMLEEMYARLKHKNLKLIAENDRVRSKIEEYRKWLQDYRNIYEAEVEIDIEHKKMVISWDR